MTNNALRAELPGLLQLLAELRHEKANVKRHPRRTLNRIRLIVGVYNVFEWQYEQAVGKQKQGAKPSLGFAPLTPGK